MQEKKSDAINKALNVSDESPLSSAVKYLEGRVGRGVDTRDPGSLTDVFRMRRRRQGASLILASSAWVGLGTFFL